MYMHVFCCFHTMYMYMYFVVFILGARAQTQQALNVSPGNGLPIYLTSLNCDSDSDVSLFDCLNNPGSTSLSQVGLTQCRHNQDSVVHCEG